MDTQYVYVRIPVYQIQKGNTLVLAKDVLTARELRWDLPLDGRRGSGIGGVTGGYNNLENACWLAGLLGPRHKISRRQSFRTR